MRENNGGTKIDQGSQLKILETTILSAEARNTPKIKISASQGAKYWSVIQLQTINLYSKDKNQGIPQICGKLRSLLDDGKKFVK